MGGVSASQLIASVRPTIGRLGGWYDRRRGWRLNMTGLALVLGVAAAAMGSSSGGSRASQATCDRAKEEAVVALQAKQKNGTLLVRWWAGKPSISIKWPGYGGWRSILVSARLDVAEPQVAWWPRAVGRREAQYPGDQASYLRDLAAGKTLSIRLLPEVVPMADASVDGASDDPRHTTVPNAPDYPLELTFELSGLAAAITDAQGDCRPK